MYKLTKKEQKEDINLTAGRIMTRARMNKDKRLILLIEKLYKDLDTLEVSDLDR